MAWEPVLPYAVLLQDVSGYKENKSMFGYGSTFSKKFALRGMLLTRLSQEEVRELRLQQAVNTPQFNFGALKDPSVKLCCNVNNVFLLNFKQKELLLAIAGAKDRFDAIDKLEWAEKLAEESIVYVTIPPLLKTAKGIVRYIGKLPGEPGTKFGVELLEYRYNGMSNGLYKDEEFFKCEKDCAVFVALDRLSENRAPVVPIGIKSLFSANPESCVSGSKNSKNLQKQKSIEQQQKQQLYFKAGDRVIAFDNDERIVHGTVKWTGGASGSENLVGIETDVPINMRKFGGFVTGLYHMFTPSARKGKEYQLFLPFACILPDEQNAGCQEASIPTQLYIDEKSVPDEVKKQQDLALKQIERETHKQRAKDVLKLDERDIDDTMTVKTQQEIYDKIKQQRRSNQRHQHSGTHSQGDSQKLYQAVSPSHQGILRAGDISLGNEGQPSWHHPHATSEVVMKVNSQSTGNQEVLQKNEDRKLQSREPFFSPVNITEAGMPEITQFREDLKILENQIKQLGGNCDDVNSTVTRMHQNFSEIEKKIENLQTQMMHYQQRTDESIQRMITNVESAFRKAMEVQERNVRLTNELTLTQQQLLGVQSMMTSSRLWVVSHDQFTIGREIGRGAWATVHETTFRGATVAAKCLHEIINVPKTRQLFQREMEMALQCQHQNIVTFLGATVEEPLAILMELMDINLRKAYERGSVKDHQVLGILHDIANALYFLHTRPDPVIHRDVSSANVLLKALYNGEWLAKLGDLGTAKLQQQAATAGPGAMAYGAPEAGDYTKHSPKMDVYSYSILILETLTKTHPFQMVDALKAQVQQQFPHYHRLVTSSTSQQSSDRPTMYEVIGQLDKIRTTRP